MNFWIALERNWLQALVPGVLAAGVTMLVTPAVMRIAFRVRAVDPPGGRKQHEQSTPRLGGVAIAAGIVVSLVASLRLLPGSTFGHLAPSEMAFFSGAVLIIFVVGLTDDIIGLGPLQKLFFQLLAASIVVGMGWQFTWIRLPLEGRFHAGTVAAVLLSLAWIVGVTNAINFIDGLDGLAAGIVGIISCSLLVLAVLHRKTDMVVVASAIAGSCIGFLRHNWRPAKVYMGDSGSLTLGFLLATISLSTYVKASAAVTILVPILALGLPVIDTLMVMWYRFIRRRGLSSRLARIFHGDRAHLHYLMIDNHGRRSTILTLLYGLAAAFCLMALLVAVNNSWQLGLCFLGVEFAAVILIRRAGLNAEARRVAEANLKRLEAFSAAGGGTSPDLEQRRAAVGPDLDARTPTNQRHQEAPEPTRSRPRISAGQP